MISINGETNLYPIEAFKNLLTVSPSIFESIREKSIREKFIQSSDILVPSTNLSPILARLSTSENNIGIVFLDNAGMQDKDNHLNNIDITTNNIDVGITNLDLTTVGPTNRQDLQSVLRVLNKIDLQNANINELNPTAPNPEVQISSTWIPTDHHQHVIENKTDEENNTMLYIRGLQRNISDEALKDICDSYGKIDSIKTVKDKSTNQCKGYGFIKFETIEAARSAIEGLKGKNIYAEFAKKRGPKPKNKTSKELLEKKIRRQETNKIAQAKYRRKQKGQAVFINPANVVQVLNLYASKFQPSKNILDEEEDIAKKFIQNLTKSGLIDDKTKSELNNLITILSRKISMA